MLARLLESRERTDRSVWGAAVSIIVHTAVIAIAVFATAEARVEARDPQAIITWVKPAAPLVGAHSPAPARERKAAAIPRSFDVPIRIEVATTPVEVVIDLPAAGPLPAGGAGRPSSSVPSLGSGETADPSAPFPADRVERQAYLESGSVTPRYPPSLRAAGIEGQVTALFVVSESGRIERGSLRFTHSDNGLFEAAVKEALERMRFVPAEVGGRKVRQLVQMPFVFRLASTEKR